MAEFVPDGLENNVGKGEKAQVTSIFSFSSTVCKGLRPFNPLPDDKF